MPLINQDILNFRVDVDPKSGISSVRRFDREFVRSIQDVRKNMKALDRAQKSYFSETRNAWREVQEEVDATSAAMQRCDDDVASANRSIAKIKANLDAWQAGTKNLTAAQVAQHHKSIEMLQERIDDTKKAKDALEDIGKETVVIKMEAATEAMKESLAKVAAPFSKLMSKDIGGAFDEGGKHAAAAIERSALSLGRYMKTKGSAPSQTVAGLATKGTAAGPGVKGKALEGLGGALKGIGGIVTQLGPLLQSASKLGPILSVLDGSLVSIVKLMIDAEAQAKEFQKDLLASASTAEFLAKNANNADFAFEDLSSTIRDIRNSAFNLEQNFKWGTTSKDHLAFWNTLNQEGVSIRRMKDEFERARAAGQAAGDAQSYYTEMTATAVAYSRKFGVALNEIVSFQAEMMTEMGSSSDKAAMEFARMGRAATDSGMASNKFFAIMRGVSSDLSLYNMRMEDAVGLLSKLGKAMSPRNAQKFMQQLAQGFKGMGRLERLRMTLLAGEGKTRGVVEKNLADRQNSLVKDVVAATKKPEADVKAAVAAAAKGDRTALRAMLKDVEGGGTMMEAARELRIDTKMSKKGLFGLSQSIGNLTTGGQLEMTKAALGRFGGKPGGKLSDLVGELGPEMMAENLGISREQLNQQVALEEAIDDQRKDLTDQMVAQGKTAEEAKKAVDAMSNDDIIKSLGISDADLKKQVETDKEIAQRQAGLTSTIMDKLGVLMDFIMNQLYNVMTGIYDALVDSFLGNGEMRAKRDLARDVRSSGSKEAMQAFAAVNGDPTSFKGAAAGGDLGKKLVGALDEIKAREQAIQDQVAKEVASGLTSLEDATDRQHKLQKGDSRLQALYKTQETANANMTSDPESILRIARDSKQFSEEDILALEKQLYKSSDQQAEGTGGTSGSRVGTGKSALDAMMDAGITDRGKLNAVLEKALWESGNKGITNIAKSMSGVNVATSGSPAPAIPGAATPAPATAPVPGAATPAPATAPVPAPVQTTADSTSAMAATSANMLATNEDLLNAARQQGVKMDKSFLKSPFGKQMEDSTYDAMSKALFEYWLYSAKEEDVKAVMKRIREQGGTAFDAASARKASTEHFAGTEEGRVLAPHAGGGIVTGVSGGIAMTKPLAAPGEGLLSVGPHEAILPINKLGPGAAAPTGGGKSSLALDVNINGTTDPDFQRGLKTAVTNYIYEYERRKRLT